MLQIAEWGPWDKNLMLPLPVLIQPSRCQDYILPRFQANEESAIWSGQTLVINGRSGAKGEIQKRKS